MPFISVCPFTNYCAVGPTNKHTLLKACAFGSDGRVFMRIFVLRKRTLLIALLIITGIALSIRLTVSEPVSAPQRELPIYSVEREDSLISLTFNCAWNDSDIDDIINTLDNHGVKSTFFIVGDWAEKYPEAVKKLSEAGHEIANHSYNHAHYSRLSEDAITADMDKCDSILEGLAGKKPFLFRAPYGEYNKTVVRACKKTGRFCIQWDVDSLDWQKLTAQEITGRIMDKTQSGSIILLHNGAPHTAEALKIFLPKLCEKGYKSVPVSQLIYSENYTIDHAGRQIPDKIGKVE
ncbi:MAG: Peptidoglycan-N-acetylmuramic acid deacetylase PdaC [Firmicutes bacterium ADurb.Bin193]|nr:MAG: Peptidoglycan-N-acetylmuramic acid deacetylase PdaC [Firmicutes bacterium ADurb.Bin193]